MGSDPIAKIDPWGLADINYFDRPEDAARLKARFDRFNPSNYYTLAGHANNYWRDDRVNTRVEWVTAADAYAEMTSPENPRKYQQGKPIIAFGCNLADKEMADLARLTGAPVVYSEGFATIDQKLTLKSFANYNGETKLLSGQNNWMIAMPDGSTFNNVKSITYDEKAGIATLKFGAGEKPLGSNIPVRSRSVCVDKDKC